jgi:hypothetical protein
MQPISRLEQATSLDTLVSAGQRAARLIRPGKVRDGLHGVWLGHPLHPVLVQASAGAWLSASILDVFGGDEQASRHLVAAGLAASVPAAVAGARVTDGSVARGPATAPQPAFQAREVGGAIQVCLPGAG